MINNADRISPEGQAELDKELEPGERVVWTGRPVARFFTFGTRALIAFGVLWIAFGFYQAVYWDVLLWPDLNGGFDGTFPCLFVNLAIGIAAALSPVRNRRRAFKRVYAITDRRAITIDMGGEITVRSNLPEDLGEIECENLMDGAGDVVIQRFSVTDNEGNLREGYEGFRDVRDPQKIESLLKQLHESGVAREWSHSPTSSNALPPETSQQSYEEIITEDWMPIVKKELEPNEEIVWVEQPIRQPFTTGTRFLFCIGAFVMFVLVSSLFDSPSEIEQPIAESAIGFLFGLVLMLAPFWAWRNAFYILYVITNKRAIVIERGLTNFFYRYPPEKIEELHKIRRKNGSGDVIFLRREWAKHDSRIRFDDYGFIRVRNPKEVEQLVRSLIRGHVAKSEKSAELPT